MNEAKADDGEPGGGDKSIQVIVAGLGRTGTMSMEVALEILGYKPYHMGAILLEEGHATLWRLRAQGDIETRQVFDAMIQSGYNATMDSPMCDVYLEQTHLYPNAKVILTRHPKGATGWAASFTNLMRVVEVQSRPFSIWYPNFLGWIPRIRDLNMVRNMIGTTTMGLKPGELCYDVWDNKKMDPRQRIAWLEELYEQHNRHVKTNVPKDKLLEFDVSDGWGPLCRFLGKPVPKDPFPHVNDSKTMKRARIVVQVIVYGWIPLLVVCGVGGSRFATKLCLQRRK